MVSRCVGGNWEESHENSICGGAGVVSGRGNWRTRRRPRPSRPGEASDVVTELDITDLDAFLKEYSPLAQASIKASGGRRLAAGQNIVALEGLPPKSRVAIIQFDSLEAAQTWRNSAQYKEARKIGDKYAKFRAFAVEGLPQ